MGVALATVVAVIGALAGSGAPPGPGASIAFTIEASPQSAGVSLSCTGSSTGQCAFWMGPADQSRSSVNTAMPVGERGTVTIARGAVYCVATDAERPPDWPTCAVHSPNGLLHQSRKVSYRWKPDATPAAAAIRMEATSPVTMPEGFDFLGRTNDFAAFVASIAAPQIAKACTERNPRYDDRFGPAFVTWRRSHLQNVIDGETMLRTMQPPPGMTADEAIAKLVDGSVKAIRDAAPPDADRTCSSMIDQLEGKSDAGR